LADSKSVIFGYAVNDYLADKYTKCIPCIHIPKNVYTEEKLMEKIQQSLDMEIFNPILDYDFVLLHEKAPYTVDAKHYNHHSPHLLESDRNKNLLCFNITHFGDIMGQIDVKFEQKDVISACTDLKTIRCSNLLKLLVKHGQ